MPAARRAPTIEQEALIGRRIALVSMVVGTVLSVTKIVVGMRAHSSAVISDGLEASGDVLSSGIVYAGLWLAGKPPDKEHPYGHGRYETLAGLGIGAILLLASAAILWHSLTSLGTPSYLPVYAVYPLLFAVVVKCVLAISKFRIGAKIASTALRADAWHDITDLLSTSVALVAVGVTLLDPKRFGNADQLGGILIGIIILLLSLQVVHRTVDKLLDTMPEPRKLAAIRQAAMRVKGALAIEKCFARPTGLKYYVDLHLEVDPNLTVRESHQIATRVRIEIKESLPWVADVLVHVEPSPFIERLTPAGVGIRKNADGE